jgi:hypothetical protein
MITLRVLVIASICLSFGGSNEINWENKLLTVFKSNARFKAKWCSKEEFYELTVKGIF